MSTMIHQLRKGFTLIEILVVMTIISLLASVAAVSYTSVTRSSRDARRQSDLEQVRSALEQYRSNNGMYPAVAMNCSSSGAISDGSGTYLSTVPRDPRCPSNSYYISTSGSDYTIGAYLEATTSTCASGSYSCGSGVTCNYCVGPYGRR